jgi:hypothetical protein
MFHGKSGLNQSLRRATACRRGCRVAAVGLNRVGGLDGQSIGLDDIGKAGAVFGLLADAGGKVGHRRLVAFGGEGEDDFGAPDRASCRGSS